MDKRIIARILFLAIFGCISLCAQNNARTFAKNPAFRDAIFGFVGSRNINRLYYKTYPLPEEAASTGVNPLEPVYKRLMYSMTSMQGMNKYYGPAVFEIFSKNGDDYQKVLDLPFGKKDTQKMFLIYVRNPKASKTGAPPDMAFREFLSDSKRNPYGTLTIYNFTNIPMSGIVNGHLYRGIGETGTVIPLEKVSNKVNLYADSENGPEVTDVKIYAYDKNKDTAIPAYVAQIIKAKHTRYFLFLFPTAKEPPHVADSCFVTDSRSPTEKELKNLSDAI